LKLDNYKHYIAVSILFCANSSWYYIQRNVLHLAILHFSSIFV